MVVGGFCLGYRADQGLGSGATVPRFMTLATPAELLDTNESAGEPKVRPLTLAARSHAFQWRRWI